jgi:hypothetical protein
MKSYLKGTSKSLYRYCRENLCNYWSKCITKVFESHPDGKNIIQSLSIFSFWYEYENDNTKHALTAKLTVVQLVKKWSASYAAWSFIAVYTRQHPGTYLETQ